MELEELKKMKETVETAARDVESSIHGSVSEIERELANATSATGSSTEHMPLLEPPPAYPEYRHPKKKWRLKQGATPGWYKARAGIRTKALSGAARVARYRPDKLN
jgi:sec-independent protein translocase protein TatB